MNESATPTSSASSTDDPRVYFAAERTFLAWIRTGIALMGFGFVLARFGIFLRQIASMRDNSHVESFGASIWIGVTLVVIGVIVLIASMSRHLRLIRILREGRSEFNRPSTLAIVIAIALACIGLFTAIYLVFASNRISM